MTVFRLQAMAPEADLRCMTPVASGAVVVERSLLLRAGMGGSGKGWSWRRWWAAVMLLACALAASAASAVQGPSEDWASRGDPVFNRALVAPLSLTAMVQDSTGWIWLGTQSGLGRWDGQRMHLYVGDLVQPGALPDSYVLALHVDPTGTLWIGTSAGGLVRHDPLADRFVSPLADGVALSRQTVPALLSDGDHGLWVGTGGGLDLLDKRSGSLQPHARLAGPLGLPARAVHALLRGADGTLWVGTEVGLFRQARDGARFEPVRLATAEGVPPHVGHLAQDAARRVWIGTRSNGVFMAESGSADTQPLHQLLRSAPPRLADAAIRAIVEASPGDVWLGTDGEGILRVDVANGQVRRVRHHPRTPASLPDDDIFALLRDRDGLVWVGSDAGLSHHATGRPGISTWFGGDADHLLHHQNVPALLPLPDGRVFLAAGDGSVNVVHPAEGRVARLAADAAAPLTALPPGRVLCLLMEPSGAVLLGTQRGLYRVDAQARRVRRIDVPGRAPTASVWALAWQDGRLWLGGLDGLWALQPQSDGTLRTERHTDGAAFDEQRITALLPAPDGVLWVGTRSGVRHLDTTRWTVTRPAQDEPGRVGLPRGYIASMLIDRTGRLWVGSFGNGVRVLEPASADMAHRVHRITQAEGLPHNGVNAIVADTEGQVWASTDGGIARIDAKTMEVRSFGAAEGVGIPSYWTGAGGASVGGALLFGGAGGLTIVDPQRLAAAPAGPPTVAVSELRVADEPVRRTYLSNDASPPLLLPPGQRSVLVEFAVLDFGAPARNRYQYRLRGADARWQDADPVRRIAAYSHLPPGDHVLELRGARPQGPWSNALVLPLHVPPQWHETRSFQAALGALGVLLLAALVQGRTLLLRRRQRALEALVAERTAALQQRTLELQRSQGQLEQLAYHDGLTALPNRRSFRDALQRLTEPPQRPGSGFFLLLIDLDHFKQINDTHGHAAGDAVLIAVAGCLQAALREGDRVARLGGDEFAVLLPGTTDPAAAERVARRIFDGLAAMLTQHPALPPTPGISIGAAAFPADATDPDALYHAADLALYRAKNAGRNRFQRFSAKDPERAQAPG
jgi:diguanylate cyclase (GGDEF)-like protein